ncbi:ATP-dependent DNA helicase PcrA [Anaerovibrio sp. JC8]|uniref:3'-5' exonuclease n=1 Tax=Anaerovibrio sp. JC8 TaxID=1240085 RepID=UPI000A0D7775|nr:3'-5' exonuclease [Anaerovibrio sp. JC8]ORU00037.1 ATP-dependent DNA helicase PcrA [Anaerovibrio sp. JC8]
MSGQETEKQREKLNEKQLEVVNELDSNILLIASAGTGKTNTLAYRIAHIIEENRAEGHEIACLTFTNKACSEMKNRVMEVVGEAANDVTIKTFHGFCYEIIRQEVKRQDIGIAADSIIYDEDDCLEIIRNTPELTAMAAQTGWAAAIQKVIGLVKEYRGEYDYFTDDASGDYQRVIDKLLVEKGQRFSDAARVNWKACSALIMEFQNKGGQLVHAYDNALRMAHAMDFCDLINIAFDLLKNPEVRERWSSFYRFWCIDEVQDTSRLEYSVLEALFGQNNIIMCGDFFQTIYEWRGSQPDLIFDKFFADYQPRLIVFNKNYRSTRILLDSSYEYLKKRFPDKVSNFFPDDALAMSDSPGDKIVHASFRDSYIEADWIYNTLQKLKPDNLSRVCILTRSNVYNKKLSNCFSKIMETRMQNQMLQKGVFDDFPLEFMLVDEFHFFRRQEIKDVLAVFNMLINEWDDTSICRVAKEYAKGIGARTIDKLQSEEALALGIRPSDMVHPSTIKYDEPFEMLRRELEQGNVVVFDVESTGLDTSKDEIVQIAAIRIDKTGAVLDKMNLFLKATKSVGQSVHTHHITDEQLQREGVDPKAGLQAFLDFAKDSVIVGHNVGYDLTILASQLKRLKMEGLQCQAHYDTLDIFRRFYPKLENHKLSTVGDFVKVSHKSTHDAFDDISATGEILIYAVNNNIVEGIDERRRFFAKYSKVFAPFAEKINEYKRDMYDMRPQDLMNKIIRETGILTRYQQEDTRNSSGGRSNSKVENLRQLYRFMRERDDKALSCLDGVKNLLNLTSLSNTEFDLMLASHPKIPIITVHQAKGLEFDQVFFAGLQEGVFPSKFSIDANYFDEEARLFYVGITRAKKQLYLTSALERNKNTIPSRFINSIPRENIEEVR